MQENRSDNIVNKKPNVTIDTIIEDDQGSSINKKGIKNQFNKGSFKKIFISFIKIIIIATFSLILLSLIYSFIIKGSSFDVFVIDKKIDSNLDSIDLIEKKLSTLGSLETGLSGLESLKNEIIELDSKINLFIDDYNTNPPGNNLEKFNLIDNRINNISLKIVSLENKIQAQEDLSIDTSKSKKSNIKELNELEKPLLSSNVLLDKSDNYNQDLVLLKKEIYQLTRDLNTRNIFSAELLYKDILSNVNLNKFFTNEVIELRKLFPEISNIKKIEILSYKMIPTKDSLLKDLDSLQLIDIPKTNGNYDVMSKFLSKVSKEITIRRVDNNIENISLSEVKDYIVTDNLYEAISLIKKLPSNNVTKNLIIKANSRLDFLREIKILNDYILEQKNKKFILEENPYE